VDFLCLLRSEKRLFRPHTCVFRRNLWILEPAYICMCVYVYVCRTKLCVFLYVCAYMHALYVCICIQAHMEACITMIKVEFT
jgi:hypothetical protein